MIGRTLLLVLVAMAMFAIGAAVIIIATTWPERLLAGVAILGSLAVVIANVTNGHK